MAITVEDAITKLTTGYWNKNARTEANPGGFGANGHVDNLPALADALGVVGDFVGTQGLLADQVLAIQAELTTVAENSEAIGAVAGDIAAVQSAAANMAAILAAPTHAATATTKAGEASDSATAALGFRNEAQAAVGGVRVSSEDTIAGALSDKIEVAGGLTAEIVNPGANERLRLTAPAQLGAGGTSASGSVVLTNESPAVQAITTTSYGQSVTLPDATTLAKGVPLFAISNRGDYDLAIKDATGTIRGFLAAGEGTVAGLADNATAAGSWVLPGTRLLGISAALEKSDVDYGGGSSAVDTVYLDAGRTLVFFGGENRYAAVLDEATGAWGAAALVRAGSLGGLAALLIDTDKVLVATGHSSTLAAMVLTITGTTITVNASSSRSLTVGSLYQVEELIACDGSYVLSYGQTGAAASLAAITVAGTTVTLGSEVNVATGTAGAPHLYYAAAGLVLALTLSGGQIYVYPYSVSGTTLTQGTSTSWASSNGMVSVKLDTGRWAVIFNSSSTDIAARIVSVSGTVASSSASASLASGASYATTACSIEALSGGKVALVARDSGTGGILVNILTDSAGTAAGGTPLTWAPKASVGGSKYCFSLVSGGVATIALLASDYRMSAQVDVTGGSPVYLAGDMIGVPTAPLPLGNNDITTDTRGRRRGFLLRAGGQAVFANPHSGGLPWRSVGSLALLPPLEIPTTPSVRATDAASGWVNWIGGTNRPQIIRRVTLAQP